MVRDMNPPHHENAAVFFDFADYLGCEASFTRWYFARFQRASECPRKSATSRRDEIVKRGGVWLLHVGVHSVVLGNLGVDTKKDRLGVRWQVRATERSLHAFDANL